MTIFLYAILFVIGTLIGSFCTLAVYRIPLKKNITHERSFCPNCNHKLNFLDLIPVFSYIFLRGKCRYCGKKIRKRYLILELLAGIITVLYALSFNFKLPMIEINNLVIFFLGIIYITSLTIIAGIDKEKKQVQKSVFLFNVIVTIVYIIYLFVVGQTNINRYAIYLFFMFSLACLLIYDIKAEKKRKKPFGFYISVIGIILIITQNAIINYFM